MNEAGAAIDRYLAQSTLMPLRRDGAVALYRGTHGGDGSTFLLARAATEAQEIEAAQLLDREYAMRARLDPSWAVRPHQRICRPDGLALFYDDVQALPLTMLDAAAYGCVSKRLYMAISIAYALGGLHTQGLVHKNIKPANIMARANGDCWLSGFGLATVVSGAAPDADTTPLIVGTPAYMSPEHTLRTRHGVDARSDLYSLGVTLYEMFTGALPFDAGAAAALGDWAHSHMARAPAPPHLVHQEVPVAVSLIILKLLDKNPSRRYQSAAGLQADLGRCADAWSRNEHIEPFGLGLQDAAPPEVTATRAAAIAPQSVGGHSGVLHDALRDDGSAIRPRKTEQRHPDLAPSTHQHPHETISLWESHDVRDMTSVLQASHALSEEIVFDKLVETLLTVTLRYAGAQRGLLVQWRDGVALIEASACCRSDGLTVTVQQSVPTSHDLPLSMLEAVQRTRQRVGTREHGETDRYTQDPYLQSRPACSAVCIPIIKRTELVGVLYLENALLGDAFSPGHTKVLELLAAQAAISLETARLYADQIAENQRRRQIEHALRASEASLSMGEQISHTGSWRWDREHDLLVCSAEFCRIFEFDPANNVVPFDVFLSRIHPEDRHEFDDMLRTHLPAGRTLRAEYRIVRPDGAIRYISGVGKPMIEDDSFSEYVGTATDITVRREADDALRTMQADLARVARATTVGQLTASIAHEINQPLMSIVSNAGASLRWLDREEPELSAAREGLLDIASEAQRAGEMIKSLQALTRNAKPSLAPVDLHDTVRHILKISRRELERRDVRVRLSFTSHSAWVMGDTIQLQQVLLNLVINAIEAMIDVHERPRVLALASWSMTDEHIQIRVEDNGVGLTDQDMTRVFEPFFTRKENGMGMGLAICRSIVDAHGGSLHATRNVPQGSAFILALPTIEPPCSA